ncbi:hypothetical protein BDR03DRAFT_351725 [Suillus americanus]|nr:hypothetical protein BDR03DRAFT_351725 [Suillus americanus]
MGEHNMQWHSDPSEWSSTWRCYVGLTLLAPACARSTAAVKDHEQFIQLSPCQDKKPHLHFRKSASHFMSASQSIKDTGLHSPFAAEVPYYPLTLRAFQKQQIQPKFLNKVTRTVPS